MTVAVPPLREERPQASRSAAQPAPAATPILDVRGYSFWYGDVQALFDLTLTISRQAITALIGPSGCGKTTFLRSINRLNELISRTRHTGDILLEGVSVFSRGTDPVLLRRLVGMVFQQPNPFPKSIFDNVAYGPASTRSARSATCRIASSAHCAARHCGTRSRTGCTHRERACRAGSSASVSPARSR